MNAGVSLKLSKFNFFQPSVDYLGHVVHPGKLAVASKNVAAFARAEHPRTRIELRSFPGMCNVYRKFVPNFANSAAPLTNLLNKGQPIDLPPFDSTQAVALKILKDALTTPSLLCLPKDNQPYTLDVDASDYQLGATLQKFQDERLVPCCGYCSRTMNFAERNYSAPDKECLAVVWAILHLRPYL
jgi:RNase H-like domain found in reverse transcriptase